MLLVVTWRLLRQRREVDGSGVIWELMVSESGGASWHCVGAE